VNSDQLSMIMSPNFSLAGVGWQESVGRIVWQCSDLLTFIN